MTEQEDKKSKKAVVELPHELNTKVKIEKAIRGTLTIPETIVKIIADYFRIKDKVPKEELEEKPKTGLSQLKDVPIIEKDKENMTKS